jgi:hypothetical protein
MFIERAHDGESGVDEFWSRRLIPLTRVVAGGH